jgi:CRP-like cAMP-binding protein
MTNFWDALTADEQRAFTQLGRLQEYPSGKRMILRAGTDRWAAVLRQGAVRVQIGPDERVVAVRWPGELVGELSLIDEEPRSATVKAVSRVRALVIAPADFARLRGCFPRVHELLLDVVAQRLREADRRRGADGQPLRVRLAGLLLEYADQHGVRHSNGHVTVPITSQADVAGMIGVRRVPLARVLKELRADHVIATGRRTIEIQDVDALRDIAGRGTR